MRTHLIGHIALAGGLVVVTLVACGGSGGSNITDPDGGSPGPTNTSSGSTTSSSSTSSSSGSTSSSTSSTSSSSTSSSGSSGDAGHPSQCTGTPQACVNNSKKPCDPGFTSFEFAPGCCECRLTQCTSVTCPPAKTCAADEHVELAGCCESCVKNTTCAGDGSPCTTYQCPTNYKATSAPNDSPNCCSSCAVDEAACAADRATYAQWLETRLAQPGALDCVTVDDCEVLDITNACQTTDCGHGVAKTGAAGITSDATTYANAHCVSCPASSMLCSNVAKSLKCIMSAGGTGKCVLSAGLPPPPPPPPGP